MPGFATMLRIQVRTGWLGITAWVGGTIAMMLVVAVAINRLYPDAASLAGYAATQSNPTTYMLNGRVAGLATRGGVMANEFGFLAAFLFPMIGIAIVTRGTRRDEELGRLELLRSGPIGRQAPLLAAVTIAVVAGLVAGLGCSLVMAGAGAPPVGAAAFGGSWAGVTIVFAALAAVIAQVVERGRSVWMTGLGLVVASYLLRGVGDARDLQVRWLSPLGWEEEVRAFGALRWWPLALPIVAGALLLWAAVSLNARRDLGDALLRGRPGAPRASAWLTHPLGRALVLRRGVTIGWAVITGVLMAVYGAFTDQIIAAIDDNPQVREFMAAGGGAAVLDQVLNLFLTMLMFLVAGFIVQGVAGLRGEEEAGMLEYELAGATGRARWLTGRLAAVVIGALVVGAIGVCAIALTTAVSTDDASNGTRLLVAAVWTVPAMAVFVAVAAAFIGVAPRLAAAGWGVFAVAVLLAYLGPGLGWPGWVVALSPFHAVGDELVGDGPSVVGSLVLCAITVALLCVAYAGFRRRDIPAT